MPPLVFVMATVLFTVYGQLIVKHEVSQLALDGSGGAFVDLIIAMFTRPLLLSGLASAFLASLTWMMAVSKLELSYAYPFMALNFVLVSVVSWPLFGDRLDLGRSIGLALIVCGVLVVAQGS